MTSMRNVNVECEGTSSKPLALDCIEIEKSKRIIKGLKSLFILWGCAGFSVFVPILHFILVPGFFLAGLFFAISGYVDKVKLKPCEISCLKCQTAMAFDSPQDQFPKWLTCPSCKAEHKINLIKNEEAT